MSLKGEKKRKLYDREIDHILSLIKPRNASESAMICAQNNRDVIKKDLKDIEIYPSKIKEFANSIYKSYNRALVEAGEMVGIIAACSIGEPTTQATLNSVDWTTKIEIYIDGIKQSYIIGEFIDKLLEQDTENTLINGDTFYLEIKKNMSILSVNEQGKITLEKIKAITKHLPINDDKTNTLLDVSLESGKNVIATKAKSFLIYKNNKIKPIKGSKLKLGDLIPVDKVKSSSDIIFNDVSLEKIIDIKEIEPSHRYVYDLTVENTKNFMIENGVLVQDTFHEAGRQSKTTLMGVPRLQECMDATKKPKTPSCFIVLNDKIVEKYQNEINKLNKELTLTTEKKKIESDIKEKKIKCINRLESYRKYIVGCNIKQLLEKYELQYKFSNIDQKSKVEKKEKLLHPLGLTSYKEYKENWWSNIYNNLYGSDSEIPKEEWIISLKFNIEKLYEFNITLSEISNRINKIESFKTNTRKKIRCNFSSSFSPINEGTIEVYIDFSFIDSEKLCGDFGEDKYSLITDNNINYYYARDIVLPRLLNTMICGIEGITNIFPNEYDDPITKERVWGLDTQGANFRELLKLPFVDYKRVYCDDFWQIYHTLGILPAREVLLNELFKASSFGSAYINPRHIQLLSYSMTTTGIITSVRREGIKSAGPISKSAFEKTMENFAIASMFTEQENVKSVSASITMGRTANIGTNLSKICIPDTSEEKPIISKKEELIRHRKAFDILNMNKKNTSISDKFYSLIKKTNSLKIIDIEDSETNCFITVEYGEKENPNIIIKPYINLLEKCIEIERVSISSINKRKNRIILEIIKHFDDLDESDDDTSDSSDEGKKEEKIELIEEEISEEDDFDDEESGDEED